MAATFQAANGNFGVTVASGNTVAGTTSRDIQAGEKVVVVSFAKAGMGAVTGVTVGSLSLALDKRFAPGQQIEVWSADAGAFIATGATMTITYTNVSTNVRYGKCFSLAGAGAVRGVPQTANGVSANPSVISDANPLTGDIAVAATMIASSTVPTVGAGYTIEGTTSDGTTGSSGAVEYNQLVADGATTAGFNHASSTWSEVIVVWSAAASGARGTQPIVSREAQRRASGW